MPNQEARTRTFDLADKVAFLRQPAIYPDHSVAVEAIETHMAWVFLSRTRAWKIKKPVRYSYLDFSTLEARRQDCSEEVRLNAQLAPDVYLGTVPLTAGSTGALTLDGSGEVVDWLVVMRRLNRDRTLERAIVRGDWTREDADHVVAWLAAFYARAARPAISPVHYRARLRDEIEESRRDIDDLLGGPGRTRPASPIAEGLLAFLEDASATFDERVVAGGVLEAHGDLRPEHIFLGAPPAIIDCIEFNASFRILDAIEDLGFLAIECERLGAPELGQLILDRYAALAHDSAPAALVAFHTAQRALLRAKIAIWHLREDDGRRSHWVARCRDLLELAAKHAALLDTSETGT